MIWVTFAVWANINHSNVTHAKTEISSQIYLLQIVSSDALTVLYNPRSIARSVLHSIISQLSLNFSGTFASSDVCLLLLLNPENFLSHC